MPLPFANPPPGVRETAEGPSFRILADSLNNIEKYEDTTTKRLLRNLIPRLGLWKTELEYVATLPGGLDVLMYHIFNTYDTYHMTWREPYKDHSQHLDHLVTAVAFSLPLTPVAEYRIWHLDIALKLVFDTPTERNLPLSNTHMGIVEGIFSALFKRLSDTSGMWQHEREVLVKKMLDYTTGFSGDPGPMRQWETAVKILNQYIELHGDIPRGRLARGDQGSTYLHSCVYLKNHKVLNFLLESFEEGRRVINSVNGDGDTALRVAIEVNSVECVETLLRFKARVNVDDMALIHYPGYGDPNLQQEIRRLLERRLPPTPGPTRMRDHITGFLGRWRTHY